MFILRGGSEDTATIETSAGLPLNWPTGANHLLPDEWELFTPEEKMEANPYGCLDVNDIRANNGLCLAGESGLEYIKVVNASPDSSTNDVGYGVIILAVPSSTTDQQLDDLVWYFRKLVAVHSSFFLRIYNYEGVEYKANATNGNISYWYWQFVGEDPRLTYGSDDALGDLEIFLNNAEYTDEQKQRAMVLYCNGDGEEVCLHWQSIAPDGNSDHCTSYKYQTSDYDCGDQGAYERWQVMEDEIKNNPELRIIYETELASYDRENWGFPGEFDKETARHLEMRALVSTVTDEMSVRYKFAGLSFGGGSGIVLEFIK